MSEVNVGVSLFSVTDMFLLQQVKQPPTQGSENEFPYFTGDHKDHSKIGHSGHIESETSVRQISNCQILHSVYCINPHRSVLTALVSFKGIFYDHF